MAHLGEHLDVVPLVADGERLGERDAETPGEPPDRPALRDARRHELEEARVADGHVRDAGEGRGGGRCQLGREGRLTDREDLRDRVVDRIEQVGHQLGRARP